MRRLRTHKRLLIVCIGLLAFAVCLTAATPFFAAVLVPLWTVVPAVIAVLVRRAASRSGDQPVSLLSLVISRAPPAICPARITV